MSSEFKPGEKVFFKYRAGQSRGIIQEKVTEDTDIGTKVVHATKEDPQYIIKQEKTGILHNRHVDLVYPRGKDDEEPEKEH